MPYSADEARLFLPDALLLDADVRRGWGVLARDGWIAAVGPGEELARQAPDAERIDLAGHLLMTGTVNAHSHSFQSLLRGLSDDKPFFEWRRYIHHLIPMLDEEGIYGAALFAFGEMLLRGVTTVCDFFYVHHGGIEHDLAVVRAARELGIRVVFARTMLDSENSAQAFRETPAQAVANTRALAARLQGDPLVSILPAPHSPHGASGEMIQAGSRLAAEWGVPWHIHVAEGQYEGEATRAQYGLGPLAWMASLGAVDERLRIVHGVWLDDEEIALLGRAGGGLIHCAGSNLFLGDGIAPLPKYFDAGVTVSVGCDSGSANNKLSIFNEMRLAATLQKGIGLSSDRVPAEQALAMGTRNGAHAAGQPIGTLEVGAYADFVALDLGDLSLQPAYNLARNVVYSLEPTAIRHVWVHGDQVVSDGRLVRVRERDIAEQVGELTRDWATVTMPE